MAMVGMAKELDSADDSSKIIEELGHYAVNEHNAKEGKKLHFKRVVSSKQRVIQGILYYLDIEASEGLIHFHHKIYEAEVWLKAGDGSKSLEKFELKGDENVAKLSEHKFTPVAVDDPPLVEAAELAVEKMNADKNFVVNYELVQITSANAKLIRVADDDLPFSCLGRIALFCGNTGTEKELYEIEMTVARGTVQEILKAEIYRSLDCAWTVKEVTVQKNGWTFTF